jgi:hypothetical protein
MSVGCPFRRDLPSNKKWFREEPVMAKDLPDPISGPVGIDRSALPPELAEMLDQSERDYVGWNPEVQATVAGTVADITPNCDCGGYGGHYLLFIDEPGGNGTAVHCFHTTLRNQIEPRIETGKLRAGDLIVVSYTGKQASKTKGHADMATYRVVIRQKGILPKA